jgi:hypothetical protein
MRHRPRLLDQTSWKWLRVRWGSCGEALDVGPIVESVGGRDEQVSWQQTADHGSVPGYAGTECPGRVADDAVVWRRLAAVLAEPCLERTVAGRDGAQQIIVRGVRQRQRDRPPCNQQEDRHHSAGRPIEPAEPCHLHLSVIGEGPEGQGQSDLFRSSRAGAPITAGSIPARSRSNAKSGCRTSRSRARRGCSGRRARCRCRARCRP